MLQRMIGVLLLACSLIAGAALAEDGYPQPYQGELVGTWVFAGGAEEHGDGFRLNADGTGVHLEIVDYEQIPLQYREAGSRFTWEAVYGADRTLLVETCADGSTFSYEIETYGDARIHIPNEWSGGFYLPLTEEAPVSAAEDPAPADLPELTSRLGSFPKKKTYPVYEVIGGEVAGWRRAGNGRAKVSTNGDIWVYATWKGALLVEYEIGQGRSRIGWIDASQLPASTLEGVPALPDSWDPEENLYGVVTRDTYLTDDPHYTGLDPDYTPIPAATSVRCLGRLDNELLVMGFIGGELHMGFIPAADVVQGFGFAGTAVYSIDQTSRFTEQDVRQAMNAVTALVEEEWPGTAVLALRYIEAESADPAAWWQDEAGELEGILLYADLNSMALWDMEIGYFAEDYLFVLYREPDGTWYVGNYGYT